MKRISLDLADLIDSEFESIYGVRGREFVEILFMLSEERNDLLIEHLHRLQGVFRKTCYRKIIDAYNDAFPENVRIEGDDAVRIWEKAGKKRENLIAMLIMHSDLRLQEIYSFTLEDARSHLGDNGSADKLRDLLEKLSFSFGDLAGLEKEYIVLNNPVLTKPFIKIGADVYFSAIWSVIPHFALSILENLIWTDEGLRDKYTSAKSKYLEDETKKIFQEAFPKAQILGGSLWRDETTGILYENDLTVVVENFAIVIEEKSGIITESARRGAPQRLFETLKQLIEEPSEEALRFIDYLEKNKRIHEFRTRNGGTNVIDSSKVDYYVPLGVTFSHLGAIGSNIKKLIEAKVVDKSIEEMVTSLPFTDLETVFQILESEPERIHYLSRRREFEAHVDYQGDELDLFAFYLDNGFNIGETECSGEAVLNSVPNPKS